MKSFLFTCRVLRDGDVADIYLPLSAFWLAALQAGWIARTSDEAFYVRKDIAPFQATLLGRSAFNALCNDNADPEEDEELEMPQ